MVRGRFEILGDAGEGGTRPSYLLLKRFRGVEHMTLTPSGIEWELDAMSEAMIVKLTDSRTGNYMTLLCMWQIGNSQA